MARESGIYRRKDSRFWWIKVVLPDGKRVCESARTEDRKAAEALVAKSGHAASEKKTRYADQVECLRPTRGRSEASVRHRSGISHMQLRYLAPTGDSLSFACGTRTEGNQGFPP